jgi:hypothetical protein
MEMAAAEDVLDVERLNGFIRAICQLEDNERTVIALFFPVPFSFHFFPYSFPLLFGFIS